MDFDAQRTSIGTGATKSSRMNALVNDHRFHSGGIVRRGSVDLAAAVGSWIDRGTAR